MSIMVTDRIASLRETVKAQLYLEHVLKHRIELRRCLFERQRRREDALERLLPRLRSNCDLLRKLGGKMPKYQPGVGWLN